MFSILTHRGFYAIKPAWEASKYTASMPDESLFISPVVVTLPNCLFRLYEN